MAYPDLDQQFQEIWGWGNEYCSLLPIFAAVMPIYVGDNPAYTADDFFAMYPQFSGKVPLPVLNAYIGLASGSLSITRYGASTWPIAMGLFIAHYLTLWLQASSGGSATVQQLAASGLSGGIKTSASAGGVSYSSTVISFADAGAWNLTTFGLTLYTLASAFSGGSLLAW